MISKRFDKEWLIRAVLMMFALSSIFFLFLIFIFILGE